MSTQKKSTALPLGDYFLDGGARVEVIMQNRVLSLKFGASRVVKIAVAVEVPKGWAIKYDLRGKLTRGMLTKKSGP